MAENIYYKLKDCLNNLEKFKAILNSVKKSERLDVLKQQDNSENTILMLAAGWEHLDIVKCILDLVPAADLQELFIVQNRSGKTAFHDRTNAVKEYMLKSVPPAKLYSLLAIQNKEGHTVLHELASWGINVQLMTYIAESVSATDLSNLISIQNKNGQTVIHSSVSSSSCKDIMKCIIDAIPVTELYSLLSSYTRQIW